MDDRTKDHVFFHRIKTTNLKKGSLFPWEDSKEFEFSIEDQEKLLDEESVKAFMRTRI
jgi:hypothetical protein